MQISDNALIILIVFLALTAAAVPITYYMMTDDETEYQIERVSDVRNADMHIEADTLHENETQLLTDVRKGPPVTFTESDIETTRFYTHAGFDTAYITIHDTTVTRHYKITLPHQTRDDFPSALIISTMLFVATAATAAMLGSKFQDNQR